MGNAVALFTLYACFGDAFHISPAGSAGSVHASPLLLNPILATKFELVVQQLVASGLPIRMYSSPGALAEAVQQLIGGLAPPPPAALILSVADTFLSEPLAAGAATGHASFVNSLTYGRAGNGHCGRLGSVRCFGVLLSCARRCDCPCVVSACLVSCLYSRFPHL